VFQGINPVAVVDRYRDDSEGSLYAITMTAIVPLGAFHGAFAFGSETDDWELHGANVGYALPTALPPGTETIINTMLYTPDASYTPIETASPAGFFAAGLNTDFAFTLGSVRGFAGYNTTLPTPFGYFPFISRFKSALSAGVVAPRFINASVPFDPPIRVYRNVTMGAVIIEQQPIAWQPTLSILYTIRPRTTDGPRVL
jgi:hypothetical protein